MPNISESCLRSPYSSFRSAPIWLHLLHPVTVSVVVQITRSLKNLSVYGREVSGILDASVGQQRTTPAYRRVSESTSSCHTQYPHQTIALRQEAIEVEVELSKPQQRHLAFQGTRFENFELCVQSQPAANWLCMDANLLPLVSFLSASRNPSAVITFDSLIRPRNDGSFELVWSSEAWSSAVGDKKPVAGEVGDPKAECLRSLAKLLRARISADDKIPAGTDLINVNGVSFSVTMLEEKELVVVEVREASSAATIQHSVLSDDSTDDYITAISSKGEMGKRISEYQWETTSLGPIAQWSTTLRTHVASMLASPFRTAIFWGREAVCLYNESYIEVIPTKHPWLLSQTMKVGWHEVIQFVQPVLEASWGGDSSMVKNQHLFLERGGRMEETFQSYNFTPIRDERGIILGVTNTSIETTAEVVGERRMGTVGTLVSRTAGERTLRGFCDEALACFELNPFDLPFVQLFTCRAVDDKPERKVHRAGDGDSRGVVIELDLQGSVGVPESHPINTTPGPIRLSPPTQTPSTPFLPVDTAYFPDTLSISPFSRAFTEACETRKPVVVSELCTLMEPIPPRGYDASPTEAVVVPIMTESSHVPQAVAVFGLNSRAAYGELYQSFTEIVARHLGTGLLAVASAEEDARQAASLVALDEAKSRFWSNASHELRTPLTLILGPLQDVMSRKDVLPVSVHNKLELVVRNGERLLTMVNKLLDFSALEGSRQRHVFRPTPLARVTRELSTLFRDAIERRGLSFTVNCEEDSPEWEPPYLNNDLYQHVFSNLVGNALKYTSEGAISVSLTATKDDVTLLVTDTGAGIPEQELGLIFDRFHRVANTSGETSGSGIGLALTLEIVKSLGAQLDVESEVGKGSTFSVKFQRGNGHLPSNQISHISSDSEELTPSANKLTEAEIKDASGYKGMLSGRVETPAAESSNGSSEGYFSALDALKVSDSTILLVDDSGDLRTYIGGLLRKTYNLVEAHDGQMALEMAIKNPPSLVVTDVMMPRLSGEGLFDALRANAATAHIPVIFLSAQAGGEARAAALERGVDDYLVKPFQSRELLARVRIHLQLAKMRDQLEEKVALRTREFNDSELRYRGLAERYTAMTEVITTGIFLVETGAVVVYANSVWHEITGYDRDIPFAKWTDVFEPQHRHIVDKSEEWFKEEGQLDRSRVRCNSGKWVQLDIHSVTEFGPDVSFIGTLTDITSQKEAEAKLLETVEQRAADSEAHRKHLELFIDVAMHEVRNPLSGALQNATVLGQSIQQTRSLIQNLKATQSYDDGVVDTILKDLSDDLVSVDDILLCTNHQSRIANDILNVSKLHMGLLSVVGVPFDLVAKMQDSYRLFVSQCRLSNITFKFEVDESVDKLNASRVIADPDRLSQAAINFIANGLKFTPQNGRLSVKVSASTTPTNDGSATFRVGQTEVEDISKYKSPVWISVAVHDSGKGVEKQELKKLFTRFGQANPDTDQYGGTGLGLYITKKLIELHHGFVEVASTVGEGSCFSFTIPVERADAPSRETSSVHPPTRIAEANEKVENAEDPSNPLKILVVEDNIINQRILKRQLVSKKFDVTVANNGQEGLDYLRDIDADGKPKFDCVVMDILMPVMDGLTAVKELREWESKQNPAVRYHVIAVTGNARQEQVTEYLNSGFDGIAIKPYKFDRLLEQIDEQVSSSQ